MSDSPQVGFHHQGLQDMPSPELLPCEESSGPFPSPLKFTFMPPPPPRSRDGWVG